MTSNRKPYYGKRRRLVVSIDIGTTFTACSFCILRPDTSPHFEEILKWPKQTDPDAKMPSLLYYNEFGNACAFGAEAEDEDVLFEAEEHGWNLAEWWKLRLRPDHLPLIQGLEHPPLPPNVTVERVFADYFRYINSQLKSYITMTHADGENLFDTLSPSMTIILTTPNLWGGRQQHIMRQAAIEGGLVDGDGGQRVRFVTEAEAAILYTASGDNLKDWLTEGSQLILCDCGGGTIDITGYQVNRTMPLQLTETSVPHCYLAGAVFVTGAARRCLQDHLRGSDHDNEESMNKIVRQFDTSAKHKFTSPKHDSRIRVEGDNSDEKLGIKRGFLKISGVKMASFFDPSVKAIKEGIRAIFESGGRLADKIILVGGLANSPYVYAQIVDWAKTMGLSVTKPRGPISKAVSSGALAWHLDSSVTSRITRFHYGTKVQVEFDPSDPEMVGRKTYPHTVTRKLQVKGAWSTIIKKNVSVRSGKEISQYFYRELTDEDDKNIESKIYAYQGTSPPLFIKTPGKREERELKPGFVLLCSVKADLTACYNSKSYRKAQKSGRKYKVVEFKICMSFGEPEITARLQWTDNNTGKSVYSKVAIGFH